MAPVVWGPGGGGGVGSLSSFGSLQKAAKLSLAALLTGVGDSIPLSVGGGVEGAVLGATDGPRVGSEEDAADGSDSDRGCCGVCVLRDAGLEGCVGTGCDNAALDAGLEGTAGCLTCAREMTSKSAGRVLADALRLSRLGHGFGIHGCQLPCSR